MAQRSWTGAELHKASALWHDNKSITDIAEATGRGRESIKHQIERRRDLFPRRRQARGDMLDTMNVKFKLTKYMHRILTQEAKRRKISIAMLVRETLRIRFIAKREFDDGNGRQTRRSGEPRIRETQGQEETFLS